MKFYKIGSSLETGSIEFIKNVAKASFIAGKDPSFSMKRVRDAKLNIERIITLGRRDVKIHEIFGVSADFLDKLEEKGRFNLADRITAEKEFITSDESIFFEKLKALVVIFGQIEVSFSYLAEMIAKRQSELSIAREVEETTTVENIQSVTTTEESAAQYDDKLRNAFYVSQEKEPKRIFSKGTDFYGPFFSKIAATIFSFIIHNNGFFEERSVLRGDKLVESRGIDLSLAKSPESASVVNILFKSLVENISLELTDGKSKIVVTTHGMEFEALLQFVEENMPQSSEISLVDINNWLSDGGFDYFPKFYYDKINVITNDGVKKKHEGDKRLDTKKDIDSDVITDPGVTEVVLRKIDTKDISKEISDILFAPKVTSAISSADPERLSNELAMLYLSDLRDSCTKISSISDLQIKDSIDSSIVSLNSFFGEITQKDLLIRKSVLDFRAKNPLNIESITPSWEFKNNFSIISKIISDPVIIGELSKFISKIIYYKSLFRADYTLDRIIKERAKKYQIGLGLGTSEDQELINDAISKISSSIASELLPIAKKELVKTLALLFDGGGILSISSDGIFTNIIKNVNISYMINKYVIQFFSSKEKVLEKNEIQIIKCGICEQSFSIPKEYKDSLESYCREIEQYSFFRKDGSIISEDELGGEDGRSKLHSISDETFELLVDRESRIAAAKTIRRTVGGVDSKRMAVRKSYSWLDINKMIFNSEKIEDQIDGLIIRNDILKLAGGTATGSRGIFSNKTLCASSLYGVSASVRAADKYYTSNEDSFECRGSTMASFEPTIFAREYQSSSYTMPYGNILKSDSVEKNTGLGFRFSRNVAFCPCHINTDSPLIDVVAKNKSYYGTFNIVAVPNIPPDIAGKVFEIGGFKEADKQDVYSAPTLPDGSRSVTSSSGYIVCGRRVPLSMFDRDPLSENYIQNLFKKILATDGTDGLVRAVKILLNYGIEMNDIKPHVESVVLRLGATSSSRKELVNSIFKQSKIAVAQDLHENDSLYIKDLGLICEHGHKFTLSQSWSFAKTHYSVDLTGRGVLGVPTKMIKHNSGLFGPKEDVFSALTDIGIFKVTATESELVDGGYVDAYGVKNIKELKRLIGEKLLYFKNDSGILYTVGVPQYGKFKKSPWIYDGVDKQHQFTQEFYLYQSGSSGLQTKNEDGEMVDISLRDQNAMSADDLNSEIDNRELNRQYADLSFADAIYPNISDSITRLIEENEYSFAQTYKQKTNVASKELISKLIKSLRLSRVWASMSADSQLDFMSGITTTIQLNEQELSTLKQNIVKELAQISGIAGLKPTDYEDEFFSKYDIDHLVSDGISGQKFLSLATIAQYYSGFSVPFIANMPPKDGRRAVIAAISDALKRTLPKIISDAVGTDISAGLAGETLNVASDSIAEILFYPYSKIFSSASSYKTLMENAVVDYTGRTIIFSYSINLLDGLKIFFSKYFLNENSAIYIGPGKGELPELINILQELFATGNMFEGNSAPSILTLDNSSFEEKITQLKAILENGYNSQKLFESCMERANIAIADNQLQINAQMAVVYIRIYKLLEMAANSIDIINIGASNQTINYSNIRKTAALLDYSIIAIARNRDPDNFERIAGTIDQNKKLIGDDVFEKNAAAYARITLNATNGSLANITYLESSIVSIPLKEAAMLPSYFEIKTIGGEKIELPYLFGLKKIQIDNVHITENIFYLALIPEIQKDIMSKVSKKIDIKEYLSYSTDGLASLDNEQGKEFAERYLPGIKFDATRLVLISQGLVAGRTSSVGLKDPVIDRIIAKNRDMTIRLGKIDDPPSFWPPPNSLLLNNFDMFRDIDTDQKFIPTSNLQTQLSVDIINKYHETNVAGADHTEFLKNIDIFPVSTTSRSMDPSSSVGLMIPLRQGDDTRISDISQISNTIDRDKSDFEKNFFSISRAAIYVDIDSSTEDIAIRSAPLDLSWAFKAMDPQFIDKSGFVRHSLVQSGSVQKLNFISGQMKLIYEWMKSNTPIAVTTITDGVGSNSYYDFINTLFSASSTCINFNVDFTGNVMRASLSADMEIFNKIKQTYGEKYNQFISNLARLTDYYNSSQILNSKYKELAPSVTIARSYDAVSEQETKSLALKLLDPYSLWTIITNPAMSIRFGGPIEPNQIDYYKLFIISTFGIADIRTKICLETGMSASKFSNEDMFDIPKFCDEYISNPVLGMDAEIIKFMRLMNITYDEDSASVRRYSNGMPICIGKSSKLANIINTADCSEIAIHPSSFIDHIYNVESSTSNLSDAEKKNPSIIERTRNRNIALQNGSDSHTIKELLTFNKRRIKDDYRALAKESRRIMAKLYTSNTKKASNVISIRKMAQSATEDDGTMIIALYHEWWGRYLDTMANLAK